MKVLNYNLATMLEKSTRKVLRTCIGMVVPDMSYKRDNGNAKNGTEGDNGTEQKTLWKGG